MPESALLMATAQIMAEGGAKHSPVNCNTVNSKTNCAASKKAKSGAARKRGANLCFCAAARQTAQELSPESLKMNIFDQNLQK